MKPSHLAAMLLATTFSMSAMAHSPVVSSASPSKAAVVAPAKPAGTTAPVKTVKAAKPASKVQPRHGLHHVLRPVAVKKVK